MRPPLISFSVITRSLSPSRSMSITTQCVASGYGCLGLPKGMFSWTIQRVPLPSAFSNHRFERTTSRSPSPSRSPTPMPAWTDGPMSCRCHGWRGSAAMRYQRRLFLSDMREHVGPAVAVHVGHHHVVDAAQVLVEDDPLERLGARLAGVAVPRAAGDEIDPAVAVHVQRRRRPRPRAIARPAVPHPAVGRLHAIPEDLAAAAAGDEVRPAVAVQVGHGRLAPGGAGQFAVDEMMAESHFRRKGNEAAQQDQQHPFDQRDGAVQGAQR